MEEKETTYTTYLDTRIIKIENVPAYVCQCGKIFYSNEVFSKIEQLIMNL